MTTNLAAIKERVSEIRAIYPDTAGDRPCPLIRNEDLEFLLHLAELAVKLACALKESQGCIYHECVHGTIDDIPESDCEGCILEAHNESALAAFLAAKENGNG